MFVYQIKYHNIIFNLITELSLTLLKNAGNQPQEDSDFLGVVLVCLYISVSTGISVQIIC